MHAGDSAVRIDVKIDLDADIIIGDFKARS